MSGTLQLLAHIGLTGFTIGLALSAFPDAGVLRRIVTVSMLIAAHFHLADALWIPSFGKGRDYADRCGIAIKGFGFAMFAISAVVSFSLISWILGIAGVLVMLFGRILRELFLIDNSA